MKVIDFQKYKDKKASDRVFAGFQDQVHKQALISLDGELSGHNNIVGELAMKELLSFMACIAPSKEHSEYIAWMLKYLENSDL